MSTRDASAMGRRLEELDTSPTHDARLAPEEIGSEGGESMAWIRIASVLGRELGEDKLGRWFGFTRIIHDDGRHMVLGTPNLFVQGWIERRYLPILESSVEEVVGPRDLSLKVDGEAYRRFRADESQFLVHCAEDPPLGPTRVDHLGTDDRAKGETPASKVEGRDPGDLGLQFDTLDPRSGGRTTPATRGCEVATTCRSLDVAEPR
ncbi:MAG: hypothetical protein KDC38_20120, partial [Planctomycetes bacterium]|nr:hypothetical protein [Planctomycetota bacterium]